MKLQNDYLDALLKEIHLRREYLDNEEVTTVYFGGGTPSLLAVDEVDRIMNGLASSFSISSAAEVTLEANPDDIDTTKAAEWKRAGINRLSIGIQSFYKEDLLWMNRAHDEGQALNSIIHSKEAGFSNISIDLIYGLPSLADERWIQNLSTAKSLGVPHLSCYALTVEPDTALHFMTKNNKVQPVNPEDQARQFLLMTNYLSSAGYEHYEISNFSLPGMRSKHNSAYWLGAKYIGLGPSAHSFDGTSRQWNVANNTSYIAALLDNIVPFESELLSPIQRFNEYIMTSLRTMEGTGIDHAEKEFGKIYKDGLIRNSVKFIERGWMENNSERLVLTTEGKLFADGIASELFETS